MTIEDEYKAVLENRERILKLKIVFWILVSLALVGLLVLAVMDRQEKLCGHDNDATKAKELTINETYIKEMDAARHKNINVWLDPNMTENYSTTVLNGSNVTIWGGDKVVCYIPRS